MAVLTIPQTGDLLTLVSDWQVNVNWHARNLRMLAAFKLTGSVEENRQQWHMDDQGKFHILNVTRKKTIANRLFENDDGEFTPALITFPTGTSFRIIRYRMYAGGVIDLIDLKCISSPKSKISGKILQLELNYFNGIDCVVTPSQD